MHHLTLNGNATIPCAHAELLVHTSRRTDQLERIKPTTAGYWLLVQYQLFGVGYQERRPVFTPSSQSNYMPWNVMIWCEQKINQVYTKPSSSLWPMSQRDHKLANHSYCINHLYKKMYGVWSAHWWHSKRQQAALQPSWHTAPSKHDHEKEGCLSHGGSMLGDKRLTEYVLFNGASTKKGRRHIANRGGNELLPHYSLNPMQTGRQEMHST